MKYRIVDENGEVQCEFGMNDKLLPNLLERLKDIQSLADIARYTPTEITLLDQLQVLASETFPEYIAANSEAMCKIALTLKELR